MTKQPLVSIRLMTYNHEAFIAQAIESVLAQEVDFAYEIVIGDDSSTDRTAEIILAYQERFPEKIRILKREKNLGNIRNFVDIVQHCSGRYIALLDGDDYWSSPYKLKTQVAFLEDHPECSGCFHNVTVMHDEVPEKNKLFHESGFARQFFYLKDIVSAHFIPTCSTVYRAGLFGGFPGWYLQMPMADWPLHVLNAQHGPYAYIDEPLAVYRVHGGGVWSGKNRLAILDKTISACQIIKRYLAGQYSREIGRIIREGEIEAAEILKEEFDFHGAAKRLFCAYRVFPASCSRLIKCFWRLLVAWLDHKG